MELKFEWFVTLSIAQRRYFEKGVVEKKKKRKGGGGGGGGVEESRFFLREGENEMNVRLMLKNTIILGE